MRHQRLSDGVKRKHNNIHVQLDYGSRSLSTHPCVSVLYSVRRISTGWTPESERETTRDWKKEDQEEKSQVNPLRNLPHQNCHDTNMTHQGPYSQSIQSMSADPRWHGQGYLALGQHSYCETLYEYGPNTCPLLFSHHLVNICNPPFNN